MKRCKQKDFDFAIFIHITEKEMQYYIYIILYVSIIYRDCMCIFMCVCIIQLS